VLGHWLNVASPPPEKRSSRPKLKVLEGGKSR
jgi:hypothetical protein